MRQFPKWTTDALRISGTYLIAGVLWISFSDWLLESMVGSAEKAQHLQTYKGWFFIVATALLLFVLVCRNVRAIVQANEAVQESDTRYRRLTDNLHDMIWETDAEGRVLFVSKSSKWLLGVEPEDAIGLKMEDYLTAESIANLRKWVLSAQNKRFPSAGFIGEVEYLNSDGQRVPCEMNAVLLRNGKDRIVAVEGISRDIRERRIAQAALKWRREFERVVMQVSSDLIELSDLDASVERTLAKIGEFAGVGRAYVFLVRDDQHTIDNTHEWCAPGIEPQKANLQGIDAASELTWFWKCIQTGDVLSVDNTNDLPPEANAEKAHWLEQNIHSLVVVPMMNGGRLAGFLGFDAIEKSISWNEESINLLRITGEMIARAVNLRKRDEEKLTLEVQLNHAQRMESIGRLAGGVAHDFNNLLTSITGSVALAKLDMHDDDPLQQTLEEIAEAADRAAGLTRQLLAFSRRQIIEPRVIDVNDMLVKIKKMLERVIGENIELVLEVSDGLWSTKVDVGQIEQVVVNLAVNARDAMPDGGRLTIETANVELDENYTSNHIYTKPGEYVMLAVSDTGHGMSQEVQKRIFEPFFTTKEDSRGTGLGLATSFGIIKQHGGSIEVYSEIGQSTTFKIYLPRSVERAADGADVHDVDAPKGGNETILVVEDEVMVRDIAVRLLSRLGYTILQADCGESALMVVENHAQPIDLLLTDVVMPNMNGRELAKHVATISPQTKVLFTSGYTENVIVHHGVLASGVQFIGKPYTPQSLAAKVRQVLDSEA